MKISWLGLAAFCAAAGTTAAAPPSPSAVATADVYIAVRTDNPPGVAGLCGGAGGSGSPQDPCDGSTQTKFDAIMVAQPECAAMYLGQGVFETKGSYGWPLRRGMKIIGAGMYQTTLKQVYAPSTDNYNFGVISVRPFYGPEGTDGDDVEVRDLTIDCNYDALQPLTVAALGHDTTNASIYGVNGRSGLIKNVRVIHSGGNLETFCIGLLSQGPESDVPAVRQARAAVYSEIRDCVVELPSKIHHALSAIIVFAGFFEAPFDGTSRDRIPYGGTGLITGCIVDGGPYGTAPDPKIGVAYGGAGFRSLRIEHCYARNSNLGYYHDTGPQQNLEIAYCTFDGVNVGIQHFGGLHQEASHGHYHHNVIVSFDSGISLCSANNTLVEHNILRPVAGAVLNPAAAIIFQQGNVDPAVNLEKNVFRYNRIHEDYSNVEITRGEPQIYGNRYFRGGAIKSLPDSPGHGDSVSTISFIVPPLRAWIALPAEQLLRAPQVRLDPRRDL